MQCNGISNFINTKNHYCATSGYSYDYMRLPCFTSPRKCATYTQYYCSNMQKSAAAVTFNQFLAKPKESSVVINLLMIALQFFM